MYAELGKTEMARECYERALSLVQGVGDSNGQIPTRLGIAQIEYDRGNLNEAGTQLKTAINLIESIRSGVGHGDLRMSYLSSKQKVYQAYIDVLVRLHAQHPTAGRDGEALQVSERARARTLIELLTEAGADIRRGVDPSLVERERSLQVQFDAAVEHQMKLLSGKHGDEQVEAAMKRVDETRTQLQLVQAQIRGTSPQYAALTQPVPLCLQEIQEQVLDKDTLLLEYALGDKRSYLFAVTPTLFKTYELPNRLEVEAAARRVVALSTTRGQVVKFETPEERGARIAKSEAEYAEAAGALSRMILEPAAGMLGRKRLLIVADGALQYVPFSALPRPSTKRPSRAGRRPLVVDHEVVSIPSASTMAVLRRELAGRHPAPKSLAVFADPVFEKDDERVITLARRQGVQKSSAGQEQAPQEGIESAELQAKRQSDALPNPSRYQLERSARESGVKSFDRLHFTRREAQQIATLLPPGKVSVALDFSASRTMAMNPDLSQYQIVHCATHSLINSQHPELSGIVLSLVDERGEPREGFLRLHDLYNLSLPAELVVLSACRTGLGKEIKGEGLVGLTRGFMYAGAARVVVSLWDVNDASTAELMVRFYRGMLKQKLRPAAALRAAQVSMWRQSRWRSPYYWGAFQLHGEWR